MSQSHLPSAFVTRIKGQIGEESKALIEALSSESPVSIHIHPDKGIDISQDQVPWNSQGRFLKERPSYVQDPHYHGGAYYPQEASSMLTGHLVSLLDLPPSPLCLDLCAAPGGKSINLLSALDERAFLISNEVIRSRAKILKENLKRWGKGNFAISSAHPSSWADSELRFDLILVDAPCSGEGMFRKGDQALNEWSPENVTFCAERQSAILRDIVPLLKEGGYLLYSTCTYSREENEDKCETLVDQGLMPFPFELPESWGFKRKGEKGNAVQAYPHRLRGEGFFISLFQREGEAEARDQRPSQLKTESPIEMDIPQWMHIEESGGKYRLLHSQFEYELRSVEKGPKVHHGMEIGQMKGKDFIPSHEVAMSGLLRDQKSIELDYQEAIRYLRKETFPLSEQENGWYLAKFEGTVLGWIKIAAGRMKNHYPKDWMIRKRW